MADPNFKGFGGGAPLVFVKKEVTTTAAGGVVTREFWEGRKAEIEAKQLVFVGAGWATDLSHDGPLYKLTATIGQDTANGGGGGEGGGYETPIEQWSWGTEQLTRDIWPHPRVADEADKYDGKDGNKSGFYRQVIEYAIENNSDISGVLSAEKGYPWAEQVKRSLSRGTTSYETEYFVLTRTRYYSSNYPDRYPMTANMVVYSTEKLLDDFNIPDVVEYALPDIPSAFPAPKQSMWGWRIRDFGAQYDGQNRITETVSWVFAIWDTLLYVPRV